MPSELNLSPPPTIPQARTYISKQMSEYTEYDVAKGTHVRVDIPRLQRSYLMKDSYIRFRLNFDLKNTSSTDEYTIAFDRAGAFGIFDRIEVYDYLGGTLIEQTNDVPSLACLLNDIDKSIIDNSGKMLANSGIQTATACIDVTQPDVLDTYYVRPPVTGARIAIIPTSTSSFHTREYTIPVMSFLGMFSDKYVPLHNGFSVYFYLNDIANSFISRNADSTIETVLNTVTSCWITNFEYVCQIMELGEQAESIVQSSQPLVISSKQYRNFSDQILGGGKQSTFRFDLNLNVVSLRNIFFVMTPTCYANSLAYPSYGHRIRNFLESWSFQYGSSYLPEIAGITCRNTTLPSSKNGYAFDATNSKIYYTSDYFKAHGYTQCLEELSKCTKNNNITSIDGNSYFIDTGYGSTLTPYNAAESVMKQSVPYLYAIDSHTQNEFIGKFAAGLNCRLSSKSTVSGIDTNGLQVSINGKFDYDNINNMLDSTIRVWAEHDSFVQIIPGVATTVTF